MNKQAFYRGFAIGYAMVLIPAIATSSAIIRPTITAPPPPWFKVYHMRDLGGVFERADSFIQRFPAGRNARDREDIMRETWLKSGIVWRDMDARKPFQSREDVFALHISQQAAESGFNRHAVSPRNHDGSRDYGLCQNNSRYLARRGITDWRSVEQQTRAQAEFMVSLLRVSSRHGRRAIPAAIAGYNAGPWCARRGVVPNLGRTKAYVARVLHNYGNLTKSHRMAQDARKETQREMIPQPIKKSSGAYLVRPGDTLWRIAQRFGTTVEELAERNGIEDPDVIRVGQVIRL